MQSVVTHAAFSKALLDPEIARPVGIVGPRGKQADKRFSIYRNNVTVSLVSALADIFPAIQTLVGEEYFRAMARIYVMDNPPSSPLLFEYGREFPAFIAAFEPAKKLFYLPDVARLERLWLDAFHAEDAAPMAGDTLAAIPPENLGEVRFERHPAAHVFQSNSAAVSIFSRTRAGEDVSGINPATPEDGLITRPFYDVDTRHLPPGAPEFITALIEGNNLGEAAGIATAAQPGFDLAAAIGATLEAGVFKSLKTK